jgi:hypothetical protein
VPDERHELAAVRGIVALVIICLTVAIAVPVGASILGPLGDLAKDSAGSNGQGWSVSDDSIDESAETALVDIPGTTIAIVFIWAFVGLLGLLAVLGRV